MNEKPTSARLLQKIILLLSILFTSIINGQTVTPWLTKGDMSQLLAQQGTVSFTANSGTNPSTVTVNTGTTYQTIDGFGWCLTEGSAEVIFGMAATQQNTLLNELFNASTGLSSSVVRISIAASDLSNSSYSYNETSGDVNMNNFSLSGPDLTYLVPILKKILLINPNIKILATPWSAPRWMKTNNAWVGGSLQTTYYAAYAKYFVKYFQAMQAQGINIWAITPQNEPENPYNEPSMTMNSTEEKNFINNQLGPQMAAAGFGGIKIIAFDHNCDNTAYPVDVLNNSSYVDGAAFHLYAGNISALSTVHSLTNKNIYFTEQYVGGPGNFSGDFGWHMQNVIIGATNNWAKVALEWNLASNSSYGPRTPGGCTTCMGAVTINSSTSYTRNSPYYMIGQISKFVKTGAQRVSTSSSNNAISAASFKNTDGSVVVVAYNSGGAGNTIKVVSGSQAFNYAIPAASAVTFKWTPGGSIAVTAVAVNPASASLLAGNTAQLTKTITPSNATNQNVNWSSSNTGVATVNTSGLVTAVAAGTAVITVTTVDGNKTATSTITVTNPATGFPGYYNIISQNSGKGLDVADNSIVSGARIQQYDITSGGGANQRWKFEDAGSGNYYIKVKSTQMRLATETNSTADGVKVVQKTPGTTNDFKWTITSLGGGYYKIINVNSGKALDVENVSTANGANIQVWTYSNGANQAWSFVQVESTARPGQAAATATAAVVATSETLSIYPNPAKNLVNLRFNSDDHFNIEIYNISGSLVGSHNFNGKKDNIETIDISALNAGIYIFKIADAKGTSYKKVIKD